MAVMPASPFMFGAVHAAPDEPVVASVTAFDAAAGDLPMHELIARGFSPSAFLNDLEPLPAFISAPSQQYLAATEIRPIVDVLAGHM